MLHDYTYIYVDDFPTDIVLAPYRQRSNRYERTLCACIEIYENFPHDCEDSLESFHGFPWRPLIGGHKEP
jgi:hypothetical protein